MDDIGHSWADELETTDSTKECKAYGMLNKNMKTAVKLWMAQQVMYKYRKKIQNRDLADMHKR